ncbi:hypothetical protein QJS10_CPB19g00524 [Acorus calamus]|uniref:Uncharacterized protein n=1 Tax=Acorus calamus TaxID=4465 RepID=A0AAV9CFI4_ACOCL|nr:hypothetical protein QJS10_CPB19g00524 [Acorus calamus]
MRRVGKVPKLLAFGAWWEMCGQVKVVLKIESDEELFVLQILPLAFVAVIDSSCIAYRSDIIIQEAYNI